MGVAEDKPFERRNCGYAHRRGIALDDFEPLCEGPDGVLGHDRGNLPRSARRAFRRSATLRWRASRSARRSRSLSWACPSSFRWSAPPRRSFLSNGYPMNQPFIAGVPPEEIPWRGARLPARCRSDTVAAVSGRTPLAFVAPYARCRVGLQMAHHESAVGRHMSDVSDKPGGLCSGHRR